MKRLMVTVDTLHKRNRIPASFSDLRSVAGVTMRGFVFEGEEVQPPDPNLGRWFKDRDGSYYWAGGLLVLGESDDDTLAREEPAGLLIGDAVKTRLIQIANILETGCREGKYDSLTISNDFRDPETDLVRPQITYGRGQTTEYGNLRSLLDYYIRSGGFYADQFRLYLDQLGRAPGLSGNRAFCDLLRTAARQDPQMKQAQDILFENRYYQPAYIWALRNGFTLPLSLLAIYDSFLHSGGILPLLRARMTGAMPSAGGDELGWIGAYLAQRHQWMATHPDPVVRQSVYRTRFLIELIKEENWTLSEPLPVNGVWTS